MAKQQRIVYFQGAVQGVGFRFTTCRVASRFDVAGTVRNLPDGRVEIVAEGDTEQIDEFIQAVAERMGRYIRGRTEQIAPYTGRYSSFDVAF